MSIDEHPRYLTIIKFDKITLGSIHSNMLKKIEANKITLITNHVIVANKSVAFV
jgi:hypothetical protein